MSGDSPSALLPFTFLLLPFPVLSADERKGMMLCVVFDALQLGAHHYIVAGSLEEHLTKLSNPLTGGLLT